MRFLQSDRFAPRMDRFLTSNTLGSPKIASKMQIVSACKTFAITSLLKVSPGPFRSGASKVVSFQTSTVLACRKSLAATGVPCRKSTIGFLQELSKDPCFATELLHR